MTRWTREAGDALMARVQFQKGSMRGFMWIGVAALVAGCANSTGADRLECERVSNAPVIDGSAGDDAWKRAEALDLTVRRVVPPQGATATVELKSVRTDTHLYVLARWRDATRDDTAHKPWIWSGAKNAYEEGPEREDMFSIAFELSGTFNADMLSGEPGVWDVWQWKATRTNPQGHAMDRTHRYATEKPAGSAREHAARNGRSIWIARPEDAGDTVERKQAAPSAKGDERVPQYLAGIPSGSAADVRARGSWADGWWTLEFERRLGTGHADDTQFDVSRSYGMAVAAHDRTGDMDKASDAFELSFKVR